MKNNCLFLLGFIFLAACSQQETERQHSDVPQTVAFTGRIVSPDSVAAPIVIELDSERLKKVKAGAPRVTPTSLNVQLATISQTAKVDQAALLSFTPGSGSVLKPKTLKAIDKPFVAGIPDVVIAKDAYVKEQNPQNFSSFGKQQGLMHGNIPCMLEDRLGNIWLGTYGGGVSRYDGKNFSHFTEAQGLSSNSVLSMLQDKDGNLWFGTNGGGLTRYDGKYFTHFTTKEGLINNVVTSIFQDRSGLLWFGTDGGVSSFDGSSFTHYTVNEGLSHDSIRCILQDKVGNLWFGTEGGGVTRYDGTHFVHMTTKDGLSDDRIMSIMQDKTGNIWFGTDGKGITRYDGTNLTHFSNQIGLIGYAAVAMVQDRNGHIWIGSNGGGILEYDGINFTRYTEKEGVNLNAVRSMLLDKSGNLWIGSWGLGVSRFDGKCFTYMTQNEGLSHKVICSIMEDRSGTVWLATGGGGILSYDGASFKHYGKEEGSCHNILLSVTQDTADNLWFGSYNEGVSKFDGTYFTTFTVANGLSSNDVRSLLTDHLGNIWFGTNGGGVTKFDGERFTQYTVKQGLSSNDVRSMAEDNLGNIWFGTMGGGACRFDGKQFMHFGPKEGLENTDVLFVLNDDAGRIWLGTNGSGIVVLDGGRKLNLTEREGLSHNVVQSLEQDNDGNLWVGTRFGMSMLSKASMDKLASVMKDTVNTDDVFDDIRFSSYTFDDGFYGSGVNGGRAICSLSDGTLWVATNDRIAIYHADGDIPDKLAPKVQLTAIDLFGQSMDWVNMEYNMDTTFRLENGVDVSNFSFDGLSKWYNQPNNLSLAYDNNNLNFKYIGITMNRPKRVRYQYMLQGFDKNWSTITDKTEVPYTNVLPGTYTFMVKAMNSQGIWSRPLEYTFTVRPPWWLTWWAYSFYAVLAVGSIASYIRWRERSLKQRQKELEDTVEERTAQVVEEKAIVEEKNKQIIDSISYAQRIQSTILPSNRAFRAHLVDSFILYLPKDIVAGDFYWFETVAGDDQVFFAACDCTGHGVPGALVSVVCHNALNKSLRQFGRRSPAAILDKTTELVVDDFNKNMEIDDEVKDGMDASLCSYNPVTRKLTWAGANNPLVLIREGEGVVEIKANKQAVGHTEKRMPYTNHSFDVKAGDTIYLITDGYADQFGGEHDKKFQRAKLRELLLSVQSLPMEEQRNQLLSVFESWKGEREQVDDVTIIGVRF